MTDIHYFAKRIAALEDQAEAIKSDIKDEYSVAANKGYNAKALKAAIKIARLDADKRAKHESDQTDLELYLAELEGKRVMEPAE